MPNDPLNLVCVMRVKPGKKERLKEVLKDLIAQVNEKTEPRLYRYELFVQDGDNGDFVWVEQWEDLAALREHERAPHYLEFERIAKEEDLLIRPDDDKYCVRLGGYVKPGYQL